jgi:hypothetical protein
MTTHIAVRHLLRERIHLDRRDRPHFYIVHRRAIDEGDEHWSVCNRTEGTQYL